MNYLGIVQKLPSDSLWRKKNTLLSHNLSAKVLRALDILQTKFEGNAFLKKRWTNF